MLFKSAQFPRHTRKQPNLVTSPRGGTTSAVARPLHHDTRLIQRTPTTSPLHKHVTTTDRDQHATASPAGTSHTPAPTTSQKRPRRPFYYGWIMLPLATLALVASSPGQTFGVSIFNEPIRLELGLSHGRLAAAYMFGTLFGAIPITYVGHQMDRFGLRATLLVVITLFALACVSMAFVSGWFSLVIGFFLLRALGPGSLGLLSGNALSFWFDRWLGTVEGVRQLGMAAAMSLVPILNVWLLTQYTWRTSYLLLGAGVWLAVFPLFALLLRSRPEDVGQRLDDEPWSGRSKDDAPIPLDVGLSISEVLKRPAFWTLTTGQSLFGMILTAAFFSIVPIFQERGLTESHVTAAIACFSVALATTQFAAGFLADQFGSPRLLAVGLLLLAGSMYSMSEATTATAGMLSVGLMGAAQGVFFGAAQPTWARYFGRRHLGKIRGVLMTCMVGSSSIGPVIAGFTRDTAGSFNPALIAFALMPLPLVVASIRLRETTHA